VKEAEFWSRAVPRARDAGAGNALSERRPWKGVAAQSDQGDGDESEQVKPDWKDYIAIGIAMLQTVLLPIVIIILVFVAIALLLRL